MAHLAALLRRLVVDLHVFHREVWQVVEHHLVLALEEVLAVECQIVYLPAINIYVAAVFYLGAGQLAHQRVEHRPLGHVERRRVIHDGVALVDHLHARTFYLYTVEVYVLIHVGGLFAHVYSGQLVVRLAPFVAEGVVDEGCLIAVGLGLQYVVLVFLGHLKRKRRRCAPYPARCRVDHGGVCEHQRDVGFQSGFGETVHSLAIKHDVVLLLFLLFGLGVVRDVAKRRRGVGGFYGEG